MAYTNIDDPSAYFQVALHSSANAATITNDGNSDLQPDFIWSKARGAAYIHGLYDSTRGVTKFLQSNDTSAEGTASAGFDLTSFNTNGFSTGNNQFNTICAGTTYVAWQWKANGGTTSTNNDGNRTSTVQVNTDAGFSIVTYDGATLAGQTIGHGLGQRPDVVMIKRTNSTGSFIVWTSSLTSGAFLQLALTNAEFVQSRIYQAGMTTTTFGVGANGTTSLNGSSYVAYCFASKQGYSKFGKYVGNGATDGPFVYTGFKPAFVMIKNASATESWVMFDSKRSPFNAADLKLSSDTADSENNNSAIGGAAYNNIDILSNGFKCVTNNAATNGSGNTLIYMAFAENPFTTSTGVPTTAR
jgi:hypothetical protein